MIASRVPGAGVGEPGNVLPPAQRPYRSRTQRATDFVLEYGLYVAVASLFVTFSILSPYFLTVQNLLNIGQAAAVLGILAAGVTIALVGGQLDLSVGSIVALSTIVIALLMRDYGLPLWLGILGAVVAASAVGLINGVIVVDLGINSIIATLATSTTLVGICLLLTSAKTITIRNPDFQSFMFRRFLGVPLPVILLILIYVIATIFLSRTKLGWHIFAVGGNASAAMRAGIKTARMYRFLFLQSAFLAAVAGVITAGRTASGSAAYGGAALDVLTAVLLGGIGLSGGGGRVERTLAGVLLLGILDNGLTLLNVPTYYQQLVRGGALLLAVILDSIRSRRMSR